MKILITGGAGYIGSHVVKALGTLGHNLVIYDNLSTGHREAITFGELVVGDLSDKEKLDALFEAQKFDAVLHFAGSIKVPESVVNPVKYYQNNTINSLNLLSLCQKYKVNKFIFSSTAATYGVPDKGICDETSITAPINPYGFSKLMTEQMLKDISSASDIRFVILRYFNVAGADPEGQIGQSFPEPFHLINVASEAAAGKRTHVQIFGMDYDTPDGTCVRDYIHVSDLANAHVMALQHLEKGRGSEILNCGYGHGFSVKEVIEKVKSVSKVDFKVIESSRREGDPAILTAKADKIREVLGWAPLYDNLEFIIESALNWEKKRPY